MLKKFIVLLYVATASAEPGVDAGIRPGDDFFAFANGAWLRNTMIPEGRERWGARNEIDERTRRQVAMLLDLALAAPPGSTARKAARSDAPKARATRSPVASAATSPSRVSFSEGVEII